MKTSYLLLAAIAATMLASCYDGQDSATTTDQLTPVTLLLSQNFDIETEPMQAQATDGDPSPTEATINNSERTGPRLARTTRASSLSDASMTDLWVYDRDFSTSELLQTIHLTEGLDQPTILLHNGKHSLTVIASRGTEPTATDDAVTWVKPHDTFAIQLTVTANGEPLTQAAALNRKAARLTLKVLDKIPANIDHLTVAITKWGSAISTTTMVAPELAEYTYTTDATRMAGATGTTINFYSIAQTMTFNADVTITAYATLGSTLATATITNVPFTQNTTTTLKGNLFSADSQFTFTLNDAWGEGTEIEF